MFKTNIRKIVGTIFHLFLFFGKDDFREFTSVDKLHKECTDILSAYMRYGEDTVTLLHIIVAVNLFCMQFHHMLQSRVFQSSEHRTWLYKLRRELRRLISATECC